MDDFIFLDLASGLSIMQAGKVRVLAIGTRERSPLLPGVPTLAEPGVTDVEVYAFQGMVGPAGLPAPIVTRLNQALNQAVQNPAVLKRFTDFGMQATPTTPEQFRKMARQEADRWGPVIRSAGVHLD